MADEPTSDLEQGMPQGAHPGQAGVVAAAESYRWPLVASSR